MPSNLRHSPLLLLVITMLVSVAQAQQGPPRIGYVYPAGGRQGTSFEVKLGGQFLDGVSSVYISGAGVKATLGEYVKPITVQQAGLLRDKLKELAERKVASMTGASTTRPAWTADDEKMLEDVRKKLATFVRRPSSPAIAETVTVQVSIAADAAPGTRELRLGTPTGLTNPIIFCVGQLPEFSKPAARAVGEPKNAVSPQQMNITLPAVINGQTMPGGMDRYQFKATKGQKLVVMVKARDLIPYLPDAVPGWFQAAVTLYDARGRELAFADHYRFQPDPVIYCEVPEDGDYALEIRDSIYRGREDFVYRISLGELPFVTSIFPLGGRAGVQTTVQATGWNLPLSSLVQDARLKLPGVYPLQVPKQDAVVNRVSFGVDNLPECLEKEPNSTLADAQAVTLPIIINGRIDEPGDCDVFRFDGRAGDEIVAEVYARRLDSPLDSVLKLTDSSGKQLAFNDDHEDKGVGLETHYADSWLRARLPERGTYYVHLSDAQHKGGSEYGYRLRVSSPRPAFELRVVPSCINVRPGGTVAITAYALRKDGFTGEIALSLKDAPRGFTLSGAVVPANQDTVRLTLTAPAATLKEPLVLHLEGRATVQGHEMVRPAVAAEDMMQAFAYRHLVSASELKVAVAGRWMPRAAMGIIGPTPVRIRPGGTARIRVDAPANVFMGKVHLELSEPPDGISIKSISQLRQGTEIVFQCDSSKAKAGLKGNLIINALVERTGLLATTRPAANRPRQSLGTLPAIPFEILAR